MLKSINLPDIRKKAIQAFNQRVRIIAAWLGINEVRRDLRSEPPLECPNPHFEVHTTSLPFQIRLRYYGKSSTFFTSTDWTCLATHSYPTRDR